MPFLLTLLKTTAFQLSAFLGLFFVIGFVLSKLQAFTQGLYQRSIGWRGILWTALIGTPVHELGHYFFCKIFRHKVSSISLYKPDRQTGNLGSVNHSYNPRSIYQKIGNFFIGAAPMITGSIVLVLLFRFILPNNERILLSIHNLNVSSVSIFFNGLSSILLSIFTKENFHSLQFWLFIYLSFAVATHLAPSWEDQKTMWRGFAWIILLLLIVNAVAVALHHDVTPYILKAKLYTGLFVFAFWYALAVSLIHLIVAWVVLLPIRLIRRS